MEVGGGDGEGTEGTRMGAFGEDSNGFRAFVEFPTFSHGLFGLKCGTPSNLIFTKLEADTYEVSKLNVDSTPRRRARTLGDSSEKEKNITMILQHFNSVFK